MTDEHAAGADLLRRIAAVLDIPVERLSEAAEPRHVWAAGECMRLWHGLRTDAGRDAALDALRRALDEEVA